MTAATVKSLDMKDLSAIAELASTIAEAEQTIETAKRKRDKLMAAARKDGFPWTRIAEASSLSRQATEAAARRGNNGELPIPRQHR